MMLEPLEQRRVLSSWSGHLTQDTLWDDTTEPYVLAGDLYVDSDVTLTIAPDVQVETNNNSHEILVDGDLDASQADFVGSATDIRMRSGGRADLVDCELPAGQILYHDGASGTVDGTTGAYRLHAETDSVTVIDAWLGYAEIAADISITGSRLEYVTLSDGTPTVTGNTITDAVPLRITDPDGQTNGFSGNTFEAAEPWIHVKG
ncbi:MAG: hypothetical protein R6U98_09865, partial [Pirellulaceae bacterium]